MKRKHQETQTLWCVAEGEEGEEEFWFCWFDFCNAQKTGNNPFTHSPSNTNNHTQPTNPLSSLKTQTHTGLSRTHIFLQQNHFRTRCWESWNSSNHILFVVVVWVCIQHLLDLQSNNPFWPLSFFRPIDLCWILNTESPSFNTFIFSKLLSYPGLTNLINKQFSNCSTNLINSLMKEWSLNQTKCFTCFWNTWPTNNAKLLLESPSFGITSQTLSQKSQRFKSNPSFISK